MTTLASFVLDRLFEHQYSLPPARRARWEADFDAKRKIVNEHAGVLKGRRCGRCMPLEGDRRRWCQTMRFLALPYADHPKYRPAWRP